MKVDQIMLGLMIDTTAVGLYSSAARISEVWYFIPSAIVSSVAPSIYQAKKDGNELLYHQRSEYDSVVLVKREKLYTWGEGKPNYNIEKIPNSVDLPDTIIETMGLYIVKKSAVIETHRRIGNTPYLLNAKPLDAFDVNWPEDFDMAELIAAGKREKSRQLLGNIKNQITSCLLSDLLDDEETIFLECLNLELNISDIYEQVKFDND